MLLVVVVGCCCLVWYGEDINQIGFDIDATRGKGGCGWILVFVEDGKDVFWYVGMTVVVVVVRFDL